MRGPRPEGPPINIAAGGPKMLQLVARYADAWNWWGWDETVQQIEERMAPIIELLQQACAAEGRDPATLGRTFDLYAVVPEGYEPEGLNMENPVRGTSEQITKHILSIGELGFDEVRCDIFPNTTAALEAMRPVVEMVHAA